MKPVMLGSLILLFGAVMLAAALQLVGADAGPVLARLAGAMLLAAGVCSVFALLRQRLSSEDRIVRLEADLCREQSARGQADHALAEADLLLARLTGRRAPRDTAECGAPDNDVAARLVHIQAELARLQQQITLDAACAGRLEGARARLEQVARLLRNTARTAEPG